VVVALRLAPEPYLNKPPTEAQYALEAIQPQDPATLNHAQEVLVGQEDLVKMDQIQMDGVWISSSGLALTTDINNTSVPIARNCVDNAAAVIHHHFLLTVSGVHGVGEHAL